MPRKKDRFPVAPGVFVYRRYRKWWADIRLKGRRTKKNLRTDDFETARETALEIARGEESIPPKAITWKNAVQTYLSQHSAKHHSDGTRERTRSVLSFFEIYMVDAIGGRSSLLNGSPGTMSKGSRERE